MNKKIFAGVAALALASMACNINLDLPAVHISTDSISASGNVVSQEREVSGFDQVELRSFGNLTIEQGETESLTIEADENVIDHLTAEVQDGKLILSTENEINFVNTGDVRYTLTVKDLKQVNLTGFGNIDIDGLQTDQMTVNLSGSGNLNLHDLQAQSFELTISGFGSADVSGSAPEQMISISGSGNYTGKDLQSADTKVVVSGFGSATVSASNTLDVRITGSGNVDYYGKPEVTQTITGFGKLSSKGGR